MLMKRYLLIAFGLFTFVALGAWAARTLGFYAAYWYTDIIFHVASGAGFGLIWLALNQRGEKRRLMLVLGAAGFAVLGSLVWELWEFAGWRLFPSQIRYYIPELGDTLGDLFCGLLGGILPALGRIRKG